MLRKRNAPGHRAEGADLFSRTDRQRIYHSQPRLAIAGPVAEQSQPLEADRAFSVHRTLLLLENAQPSLRSSWAWMLYRATAWERFFSAFAREIGDV